MFRAHIILVHTWTQIICFCCRISKIYYLIFEFNDDNNNYRFYCLNISYWFCLSAVGIVIARNADISDSTDMLWFVLWCCLRSARLLRMSYAHFSHSSKQITSGCKQWDFRGCPSVACRCEISWSCGYISRHKRAIKRYHHQTRVRDVGASLIAASSEETTVSNNLEVIVSTFISGAFCHLPNQIFAMTTTSMAKLWKRTKFLII